ncbi:UNKNOWN [Stylonychia lemnae]|uniref:Uncharacterized protein n=1 Tax=Stylonychia lemnae TaxID=5949 RepID=A0A078BF18_STYLE|nr:UNKNOWN [Stylonychia lemnae]|eukprot:CDW91747.1 UNKNOWN [Stylonychia lemnae]
MKSLANDKSKKRGSGYHLLFAQLEEENIKIFHKLSSIVGKNKPQINNTFKDQMNLNDPSQKMLALSNSILGDKRIEQSLVITQDNDINNTQDTSQSLTGGTVTKGRATFRTVSSPRRNNQILNPINTDHLSSKHTRAPTTSQPSATNNMSKSFMSTQSGLGNNKVTAASDDLNETTRNLLIMRKNNERISKLKTIDNQNFKMFQNLTRIKSSLSRQKFERHEQTSQSIRQMLARDNNRLDPLLTIEKIGQKQLAGVSSNIDKTTSSTSFSNDPRTRQNQEELGIRDSNKNINRILRGNSLNQKDSNLPLNQQMNATFSSINKDSFTVQAASHSTERQNIHLPAKFIQAQKRNSAQVYYDFTTSNYFGQNSQLQEIQEERKDYEAQPNNSIASKYNKIYMRQPNKTQFSNYINNFSKELKLNTNRHSIEEGTVSKLLPSIKEIHSHQVAKTSHSKQTARHTLLQNYSYDMDNSISGGGANSKRSFNSIQVKQPILDLYKPNVNGREKQFNKLKLNYKYIHNEHSSTGREHNEHSNQL